MELKAGQLAPKFCIPDAYERKTCLDDFKGKKIVLYFYPKDNTPGCTLEAIDFSKLKEDFEKENTVILGISKDSCKSHQDFIDKQGLVITILSDPDNQVQKKYGVYRLNKFLGKEYLGTARTTFLIDEQEIIRKIWNKVNVIGHAKDVLAAIKKDTP
jgi:thioredoxin-dependent peroxiredoxin